MTSTAARQVHTKKLQTATILMTNMVVKLVLIVKLQMVIIRMTATAVRQVPIEKLKTVIILMTNMDAKQAHIKQIPAEQLQYTINMAGKPER